MRLKSQSEILLNKAPPRIRSLKEAAFVHLESGECPCNLTCPCAFAILEYVSDLRTQALISEPVPTYMQHGSCCGSKRSFPGGSREE